MCRAHVHVCSNTVDQGKEILSIGSIGTKLLFTLCSLPGYVHTLRWGTHVHMYTHDTTHNTDLEQHVLLFRDHVHVVFKVVTTEVHSLHQDVLIATDLRHTIHVQVRPIHELTK